MKKILVFGGGISGLTIAHELIEKGFEVTVIERNPILGGMAKSRREESGLPSEHSWRGYGPFYHNVFDILKRIPFKNKTTYDTLVNKKDFHFLKDDEIESYTYSLTIPDYINIGYVGSKYLSQMKENRFITKRLLFLI